ncbi:nuclear transport factor 2 family protein [Aetokthonos hydrillicola Thurmond2011]|jgi:hypothetical protein|uniref:Nuclear transport factor 2 family protein n=1 Tax=Aetokthonos hydrillicola Thurmond2011 TaxID=2712845 RepID=A0AAP5I8M2_9CYAN|nr:nuclear transport factor 2 family protein [Aetokthonos hydrillicola]MBO3463006.1 nuclear transport factor 2 family protein [Aetokthonos hydrillicola CCALA 1050]MBW4587191.1 nuclear transport factor 2 family protein [Aetokthonos hydrillicola CCALA 1050]MDR9896785.1 nuclear transport factor 2 family protein [Aetokthonos hydrillicola Thurmond2011]
MRNLIQYISKTSTSRLLVLFFLAIGLAGGWKQAQAVTPQNPPPQLQNLLQQIDTAATQGNIKGVLQFYSPNFTQGDGLNLQTLEQALTSLRKRYPQLKYTTQLQSWRSEGNAIIADTVTTITGLPSASSQNQTLTSTITSRQRIAGGKIVHQDIQAERTQITSGAKPPHVEIKLPQQVKVGEQYNFDAILQEPLGEDYLLGAALEEPVQANRYLNPTPVNLELLTSGGLFKIGHAPATPGSQWLSAVIMRPEGMIMITQRLQVVK